MDMDEAASLVTLMAAISMVAVAAFACRYLRERFFLAFIEERGFSDLGDERKYVDFVPEELLDSVAEFFWLFWFVCGTISCINMARSWVRLVLGGHYASGVFGLSNLAESWVECGIVID